MADGDLKVVLLGLTRGDHVALLEFHGFGSLLGKLAGNDDLASLSLLLVDGLPDDGRDGSSDGDLSEKFQFDGLGHSTGAETLLF